MASRSFALVVLALVAAAGCALSERPRRAPSREPVELELPSDAAGPDEPAQGARQIPREANPAVVQSEPVDTGAAQCPGVRVLRIDRRLATDAGGAAAASALPPRFYGRDDLGRVWTLRDVLECELSRMHFVAKAFPEGINLVLWRGPYIFEPDAECEWRDPVQLENIPGGRRLHIHERCRRRPRGEPAARVVTVDVMGEEARVVMR